MSAGPGEPGREPGAVRVDPEDAAGAATEPVTGAAEPTPAEAEARAEQIRAEVARTDLRRAEDEAARADDALADAQRRQEAAHAAEDEARQREQEIRGEADAATARVPSSLLAAPGAADRGQARGEPIVFGPFTAERPELLVAAAFVGGFLLAKIIRAMAS